MLKEFVVVSWHGHRDDANLPAVVQEVWSAKFKPGAGNGQQSNVDACVMDAGGKIVRKWDAMAKGPGPRDRGNPGDSATAVRWRENLAEARKALGLGEPEAPRPVKLPGLPEGAASGIRVFTRLDDRGMPAYYAPVVELVPMASEDWALLALPAKPAKLDASAFLPWLSKMFPGGVMERTDQQTKQVYDVTGAKGELVLEPAGANGETKFALLHGKVTLTDSGGGEFSYSGELRVVVEYRGGKVAGLKGIFEGTYPRKGPQGSGGMVFDLTGVFERAVR
ncbi:MAG: hypothetical protein FD180_2165 [Planctomycetota bacterium]|nr:MAG: hypothetical protein FD180_2165 [Planctomycetota bacterium]